MSNPAHPKPIEPILRVRQLHFAHPGQAALFSDWQADFPAGITWISGDSGSGKTTLLHLLAGTDTHAILEGDRVLQGCEWRGDPVAYRQAVCWFDPTDSAFDDLRAVDLRDRLHSQANPGAWQRHVSGFGLAPHVDKPLYMLSTGTRRKVALAVALSAGCALTLLDEPTAGLDLASRHHLIDALKLAADSGDQAWVVISHQGLDGVPRIHTLTLPAPPWPGSKPARCT